MPSHIPLTYPLIPPPPRTLFQGDMMGIHSKGMGGALENTNKSNINNGAEPSRQLLAQLDNKRLEQRRMQDQHAEERRVLQVTATSTTAATTTTAATLWILSYPYQPSLTMMGLSTC